jgi:hypothetical protein
MSEVSAVCPAPAEAEARGAEQPALSTTARLEPRRKALPIRARIARVEVEGPEAPEASRGVVGAQDRVGQAARSRIAGTMPTAAFPRTPGHARRARRFRARPRTGNIAASSATDAAERSIAGHAAACIRAAAPAPRTCAAQRRTPACASHSRATLSGVSIAVRLAMGAVPRWIAEAVRRVKRAVFTLRTSAAHRAPFVR